MKKILFLTIFLTQVVPASAACLLDVESAWKRVLNYAPSLEASFAEVSSKNAEIYQVSLFPNPVLTVATENIGVHNHNEDAEPPETTFAVTQLIETGGKRCARTNFACSMKDLAALEAEIATRDLKLALKTVFIDSALAQERVQLAEERVRIAVECAETTALMLEGGKLSPIQYKKTQLACLNAQAEAKEAYSELLQTQKKLSSFWGAPCPDFEGVCFDFSCRAQPLCLEALLESIFQTPDYAYAKQQRVISDQNLKLQKAHQIPDFTLTLGYTVFHDSGQGGFLIGAEIPIPLFDRNQGNVRKAHVGIAQAEYSLDEMVRETSERITLAQERVIAALDESMLIEEGLLNEAYATYALIEEGYQNGKLNYLEVLDAKKTICEIKEHYFSVLHTYHHSLAELCRLIGE